MPNFPCQWRRLLSCHEPSWTTFVRRSSAAFCPLYLAAMSFQEVVHPRLRRCGEGGGGNGRAGQPALTLLAARTSGTTLAALAREEDEHARVLNDARARLPTSDAWVTQLSPRW